MGYGSLVGPGASFAGIDQGIDFVPTGSAGFDIMAPAAGTITLADASGHQFNRTSGQALIIEQLDNDPNIPNGSRFVYFAELINIAPGITVGVHVNAGTVIGHCNTSPGIEVGWGSGPNQGFKCTIGGETACGSSFNNWVQGLPAGTGGAPTGGAQGPQCEGCGFKGIGFNWQPQGFGIPDFGNTNVCILTGCHLKALKAGLITAAGTIIMGLGVLLLAHWGLKDTEAGRAVGRTGNKIAGLAGALAGPEGLAATEAITHLRRQPAQQPKTPSPAQQRQALRQSQQDVDYRQQAATQNQTDRQLRERPPEREETADEYLARMGA